LTRHWRGLINCREAFQHLLEESNLEIQDQEIPVLTREVIVVVRRKEHLLVLIIECLTLLSQLEIYQIIKIQEVDRIGSHLLLKSLMLINLLTLLRWISSHLVLLKLLKIDKILIIEVEVIITGINQYK
jgi:hypothetical protein